MDEEFDDKREKLFAMVIEKALVLRVLIWSAQ
jgi:hypothetical protein